MKSLLRCSSMLALLTLLNPLDLCAARSAGQKKSTKAKKSAKKAVTAQERQDVLTEVYQGLSGFDKVTAADIDAVKKAGGDDTYGELPATSLEALLNDKDLGFGPKTVFYDLGSGVGKTPMGVYLFGVKKSVGVELAKTRHDKALKAYKRLKKLGYIQKKSTLKYQLKDMLKAKMKDATIVYMCSTCFEDPLMKALTEKFSKLKKGLIVITLRPLPNHESAGFKFLKELNLPMTWSEGSPVYIYQLA